MRERLEAFGAEVLAEAVNRPVQMVNGGLYMRGLIEQGPRKSLEPMVGRLGGEADYESLQNFLAVSPWDPAAVVRAVAERVAPEIDVEAWVLPELLARLARMRWKIELTCTLLVCDLPLYQCAICYANNVENGTRPTYARKSVRLRPAARAGRSHRSRG